MKRTITEQIIDMIADAESRGLFQEQPIDFDVAMVAMPGPDGRPSPALGLTFTIQAMDMAQGHAAMVLIAPSVIPQEEVDEMVRKFVANLINTRVQAGQQAVVSQNGHKDIPSTASKSGLIIPGQN